METTAKASTHMGVNWPQVDMQGSSGWDFRILRKIVEHEMECVFTLCYILECRSLNNYSYNLETHLRCSMPEFCKEPDTTQGARGVLSYSILHNE